jgi:hypothetical protein
MARRKKPDNEAMGRGVFHLLQMAFNAALERWWLDVGIGRLGEPMRILVVRSFIGGDVQTPRGAGRGGSELRARA